MLCPTRVVHVQNGAHPVSLDSNVMHEHQWLDFTQMKHTPWPATTQSHGGNPEAFARKTRPKRTLVL